jgi:hypothetical protein
MNAPPHTTIPKIGPMTYSVHGRNGAPLPLLGPGAASPLIDFYWPRSLFVTGLLVTAGSGLPVDASHLELRIQDETQRDMFTDGQGGGFFVAALTMHGFAIKPFDLQRPVVDGDHWFLTLRNTSGNREIKPFVSFFFEEAFRRSIHETRGVGR